MMGGENDGRQENDANLCGDMRALVVVLREIRDEGRRCADALETIAFAIAPRGKMHPVPFVESLQDVAANLATIARHAGNEGGR
jgi:hypothetical protein